MEVFKNKNKKLNGDYFYRNFIIAKNKLSDASLIIGTIEKVLASYHHAYMLKYDIFF